MDAPSLGSVACGSVGRHGRRVLPSDEPDRMSSLRRPAQAGLLLALFALAFRLALPGLWPAGSADDLVRLLGDAPICHSGGAATAAPDTGERPAPPAVPAHECALCPVCHIAAAPALLPTPVLVMGSGPVGRAGIAWHPPSTGPPRHDRYAVRPRGPPATRV